MPVSMAIISSNVGGFTKRATVSAIYFIMYCAGNIVGPQLFFARQAPKYQVGSAPHRRKSSADSDAERILGYHHLFGCLRCD